MDVVYSASSVAWSWPPRSRVRNTSEAGSPSVRLLSLPVRLRASPAPAPHRNTPQSNNIKSTSTVVQYYHLSFWMLESFSFLLTKDSFPEKLHFSKTTQSVVSYNVINVWKNIYNNIDGLIAQFVVKWTPHVRGFADSNLKILFAKSKESLIMYGFCNLTKRVYVILLYICKQ